MLNVACGVDDSFVDPLLVMITSLLENNREAKIELHLFSANISEVNVERIRKRVFCYNMDFRFYPLKKEDFAGFPISDRISCAAYYRILMPDLIDSSVSRFLYLDADIIVNRDLQELFELDLNSMVIGAVDDLVTIDCNMHHYLRLPREYAYFNSGVLLVDVGKWKDGKFGERVMKFIASNYELCQFHDQDALNAVLFNYRFSLPPKYNQQIGVFILRKSGILKVYNADALIEAKKDPVIIHFNGYEKPWQYRSSHPYRFLFSKYSKIALPNSTNKQKHTFKEWFKKQIFYKLIGWGRYNRYIYYKIKQSKRETTGKML